MRDESVIIMTMGLIGLATGVLLGTFVSTLNIKNVLDISLSTAQTNRTECEKDLPRNQKCHWLVVPESFSLEIKPDK